MSCAHGAALTEKKIRWAWNWHHDCVYTSANLMNNTDLNFILYGGYVTMRQPEKNAIIFDYLHAAVPLRYYLEKEEKFPMIYMSTCANSITKW